MEPDTSMRKVICLGVYCRSLGAKKCTKYPSSTCKISVINGSSDERELVGANIFTVGEKQSEETRSKIMKGL